MNCPACDKAMTETDFGDVQVNICKDGCKGIWFDWGELTRLDENNEGLGRALEEALKHPAIDDVKRQQLNCPRCSTPMRSHKYKSNKDVSVDECYACGGFFLDSGELCRIRENFMSEADRETYVQKILNDNQQWQQYKEEKQIAKVQARTSAKAMTRSKAVSKFVKILGTRLPRIGL